jgi:hypothetical protein
LARADLVRLQNQVAERLYPLYLQLAAQEPAPAEGSPLLLPAPERTEGPHFSYAMQWFFFTIIGVVSYVLIIRRTARERDSDGAAADDQDGVPVPATCVHSADLPASTHEESVARARRGQPSTTPSGD